MDKARAILENQEKKARGVRHSMNVLPGRIREAGMPELDPIIHERIRLGIVSALASTDRLSFNELKGILKTSDGNLSAHARKLERARFISCSKFFAGRLPKTEYRLTSNGRRALERYLDHMEALIRAARDH